MKVIPFIILLLLQVYLIGNNFYSISADESAHVLDAYNFKLFGIWLPFQRLFLAPFTMIDLFWTPRIISMILGHLTLLSLMLVSKELFKNEMVTLLTGILGSVFVGIAVFSVLPLIEIYFFLFALISIYFLLKKSNWVYLTTILMTTVRFEGWIFAFIIMLFLYKEDGLKVLVLMTFPIFWLILGYFETGSLFGFTHQYTPKARVISESGRNAFYNFFIVSLYSGLIIGLFYLKKNRTYLWLFIGSLSLVVLTTHLSGSISSHNVWRTGVIWVLMIIPFTAYMIFQLYQHQKFFGLLLMTAILYLSTIQTLGHSKESYTKVEDLQAGAYLKTLEGKIIMPRYGWEFMNLLPFAPKIQADEKIASLSGYDYLVTLKPLDKVKPIYFNAKWNIYKVSK